MKALIQKHRKKLIILPVFLLIGIGFFFLIKHQLSPPSDTTLSDTVQVSKFNDRFPSPNVRDKEKNKFEIYMQAQEDSSEKGRSSSLQDNPLFNAAPSKDSLGSESNSINAPYTPAQAAFEKQNKRVDVQLEKIMQEYNRKETAVPVPPNNENSILEAQARQAEIARLEEMIASLQMNGTTGDTELNKLNTMLGKLVDMETPKPNQPAAAKDSVQYKSVSLFATHTPKAGFHSLPPQSLEYNKQKKAVQAIILGNQSLVNGSTVKLRLQEKIYVDQVEIPAHTAIDGICRISDERVHVAIQSITLNGIIYPINLSVYDTRGMLGIHAPGAITRDAAKEQLAQTMQSMGNYNVSTSVTSEIATSAIQGASNLISRKARLVKVTINSDFTVLLQ